MNAVKKNMQNQTAECIRRMILSRICSAVGTVSQVLIKLSTIQLLPAGSRQSPRPLLSSVSSLPKDAPVKNVFGLQVRSHVKRPSLFIDAGFSRKIKLLSASARQRVVLLSTGAELSADRLSFDVFFWSLRDSRSLLLLADLGGSPAPFELRLKL